MLPKLTNIKRSKNLLTLLFVVFFSCGLFENDIIEIAEYIHNSGGYLYCDGANFNALVGKVKPGDLGIDAMHINLHQEVCLD